MLLMFLESSIKFQVPNWWEIISTYSIELLLTGWFLASQSEHAPIA